MKSTYKKIIGVIGLVALTFTACKKEAFVEVNKDPNVLYNIAPEEQFLNATINTQDDFEWYYDFYRRIMPWMQLSTASSGNTKNFTRDAGNFNTRYGKIFFGNVGPRLADIPKLIEQMPAEEQAKRANIKNIASVLMANMAFYVSDVNGSMPYSEAFQARYGGPLAPKYNTQQELFDILDKQVKDAVTALKSNAAGQTSLGNNDQYFKGDVSKWIKAGNALRLKMAMRLLKRDPTKMKAIATEVLADAANLMSTNDDSWQFITKANYAPEDSNWDPTGFRAPMPTLEFMWETQDPRLRNFYQRNGYTQENFNLAKAQGKISAAAVFSPKTYVGSFTNPDAAALPANKATYYAIPRVIKKNGTDLTIDTLSNIQPRLFQAADNGGTGLNNFPVITYADFCLMRAELAARGATGESAEDWYNKGVRASIEWYDKVAKDAKIADPEGADAYVPVTAAEITTYMNMPKVKFDAAKALDQIASQAYIHLYKQPSEAWASFKRTGMPNSTTVLVLPKLFSDGVEQDIPRRVPLSPPAESSLNFQNAKKALDDMAKDPDFGQGPQDVFGRIWWDKK